MVNIKHHGFPHFCLYFTLMVIKKKLSPQWFPKNPTENEERKTYIILYYFILFYFILYYFILYYIILYCIIFYYIIFYYIILYYIIPNIEPQISRNWKDGQHHFVFNCEPWPFSSHFRKGACDPTDAAPQPWVSGPGGTAPFALEAPAVAT